MKRDCEPEQPPPTRPAVQPALTPVTGAPVAGHSNNHSTGISQNPETLNAEASDSSHPTSPAEDRSRRLHAVFSQSLEQLPTAHPLPPLPQETRIGNSRRGTYMEQPTSIAQPRSGIDWIVPVDEKTIREKTAGERLEPTVITARNEREKYAFKAKMTGYALNAAIGLQVLLGALITGLSAVTTGRQTSIMTAILGGLATVVASYLARARGSNEPELSITRVKDLAEFIRQCEAFQMDFGHTLGDKYDPELVRLRRRFEDLLGSANNGERRLSPPV